MSTLLAFVRSVNSSRFLLLTTVLLVLLTLGRTINPLKQGLTGSYFSTADRSGDPVRTVVEQPTTESLMAAWNGRPPGTFSAEWIGALMVFQPGAYTFATRSDGSSSVFIHTDVVVDNAAGGPEIRSGSVNLTRGLHRIAVRFTQQGGGVGFQLLWGSNEANLAPVPSWRLASYRSSTAGFLGSAALWRAQSITLWLWVVALVLFAGQRFWPGQGGRRRLTNAPALSAV